MSERPPWRSADVTDAIMNRGTRPDAPDEWLDGLLVKDYIGDSDTIYLVVWELENRGLLPILWRMRLHKQEQVH